MPDELLERFVRVLALTMETAHLLDAEKGTLMTNQQTDAEAPSASEPYIEPATRGEKQYQIVFPDMNGPGHAQIVRLTDFEVRALFKALGHHLINNLEEKN